MPDALLRQLLEKDKPLYSGKVRAKEGKLNLRGERNEVRADERQIGSGKLRGERLNITTADKDHIKSFGGQKGDSRNYPTHFVYGLLLLLFYTPHRIGVQTRI